MRVTFVGLLNVISLIKHLTLTFEPKKLLISLSNSVDCLHKDANFVAVKKSNLPRVQFHNLPVFRNEEFVKIQENFRFNVKKIFRHSSLKRSSAPYKIKQKIWHNLEQRQGRIKLWHLLLKRKNSAACFWYNKKHKWQKQKERRKHINVVYNFPTLRTLRVH